MSAPGDKDRRCQAERLSLILETSREHARYGAAPSPTSASRSANQRDSG
jgi:hypothetical protein